MERHDCCSITELVTYEDLGISRKRGAIKDGQGGSCDLRSGGVPAQADSGLECLGRPIGASGLRMIHEGYLQLLGRAGERQLANTRLGLTHHLGGLPFQSVCSIAILGRAGE